MKKQTIERRNNIKDARISCVIPFYNEGLRLFSMLDVVTKIDNISQIVCVDNGSDDDNYKLIKTRWPKVEVLRLEENQGKSYAVKRGLKLVNHELILLLDADLQDINQKELEKAIYPMQQNPDVDMIILRRINAAWFVKIDRADILLSGERILKKRDLEEIFKTDVKGYQLEVAINTYMLENEKNVQWIPWSATNTYKTQKCGFVKGLAKKVKMFFSIFSYAGIINFIKQLTTFARKEIQPEEISQTYLTKNKY